MPSKYIRSTKPRVTPSGKKAPPTGTAADLDLASMSAMFADEDKSREFLEAQLWPEGPVCPHCGEALELFEGTPSEAGPLHSLGLPLLGRIPFDRRIATCADQGRSFMDEHALTPASQAFRITIDSLHGLMEQRRSS